MLSKEELEIEIERWKNDEERGLKAYLKLQDAKAK